MIDLLIQRRDNIRLYNNIIDHINGLEECVSFDRNELLNDNIINALKNKKVKLSGDMIEIPLDVHNIPLFKDGGVFIKDYPDLQIRLNKLMQYNNIEGNNIVKESILRAGINNKISYDSIIKICNFLWLVKLVSENKMSVDEDNEDTFELALDLFSPDNDEYMDLEDGKLVAIEGCDCIGKDYIIYHTNLGLDPKYYFTREPGGTKVSEAIRDILLDSKHSSMSTLSEALLYNAARAQHIEEIITPKLQSGKIVITNRYYYSTLVYQKQRGVNIDTLVNITKSTINGRVPNLVISLYDKDFNIVERRIRNKKNKDRIEQANIDLFESINDCYSKLDELDFIKDIDEGKSDIYTVSISDGRAVEKVTDIITNKL